MTLGYRVLKHPAIVNGREATESKRRPEALLRQATAGILVGEPFEN
jgi:hypothetical protein